MKPKNCLIFGASGQIGRNLIRSLTKNNIKVTALTRNIHQKGYILKTQANPGYLEIVEGSIFDHELIEQLFNNADLCVNLIGILFEKGKNNFNNIHVEFPKMISKLASTYKLEKFVHLSALGIENAEDSIYAQSKVAHIDTQKLISEMPEVIAAQKHLEQLEKTYSTEIENTYKEFQTKAQTYSADAAAMPNPDDRLTIGANAIVLNGGTIMSDSKPSNAADITNVPQSNDEVVFSDCLLYTSPSPRDGLLSRMPSSA